MSQTKAVSATQHHDTSTWKVTAAPGPPEIIWGNLRSVSTHTTMQLTEIPPCLH